MSDDSLFGGNQAVEQIDGIRIRAIRERQELTQLYVATAVGVTTDTISRWENRRYPTIKRENALKLAEVLGVELAEILDVGQSEVEAPEPPAGETVVASSQSEREILPPPGKGKFPPLAMGALFTVLVVALGLFSWWSHRQGGQDAVRVTAQRLLPGHVAPGQPFPVLVRVEITPPGTYSMIIRETVPVGCAVVTGLPPFATLDVNTGVVKWIGKASGSESTFSYLARTKPGITAGKQLEFSGAVTLKRMGVSTSINIDGPTLVEVKKLHWADANGDHRIDDDEILAVYDRLETMDALGFGKSQSQVEDIWAGNGYRWDTGSGKLVVLH